MSKNLETVQAIYASFGRGEIPAILEKLHDDVEWEHDAVDHGIPWLKPRKGRKEVGNFFETLGLVEIPRFEPLSLLSGENQVVALIRVEITVKKTGRKILDLEAHVWTFDGEGKVTRFKHLVDTHQHYTAWGAAG